MSEPRQHHIVPASYLAGFTETGDRTSRLHVLDLETGVWRRQRVEKVARECDFYRVEAEGVPPTAVEQFLQTLEGPAARIIGRLNLADVDTSPEDLGHLVAFVASMLVRTRQARDSARDTGLTILRAALAEVTAEPRAFYELRDEAERELGEDLSGISLEDVAAMARGERFEMDLSSPAYAALVITSTKQFMADLARRQWSLHVADGAGFVCSDAPVAFMWYRDAGPTTLDNPNLIVSMPLSKTLALLGSLRESSRIHRAPEYQVSQINTATCLGGKRTVFAPAQSVAWWDAANDAVSGAKGLLRAHREALEAHPLLRPARRRGFRRKRGP